MNIVKRTVVFVVPLVVLFLVIFSLYEQSLEQQALQLLRTEQEKGNAIIENQLEAVFSQYVSDLLMVFYSDEFSSYVQDSTETNRVELEQLFVRIATKKNHINHIRFLDSTGMETLKIVHFPNKSAVISDPSSLVDRSETELFSFGKSHDENTVYISPISLESRQSYEDGHEGPALVLALPAYHEGSFFGLVIVDYDACFLRSFLDSYQDTVTKNIGFGLVDNDGFWIYQGGQDCSESLQEEEVKASLFLKDPALERYLLADDSGSYSSGETSYQYQAVLPSATQDLSWYPDKGRLWTVVSSYALAELPELSQNLLLQRPFLKWLFTLLLFLFSNAFIVFLQLRKAEQKQMQVSSLIAEYSGNGILAIDENNRIAFCNHAFEVLCGYTQEELIGKSTKKVLPYGIPPHLDTTAIHAGVSTTMPIWIRHRNGHQYLTNRTRTRAKTEYRKDAYTVEVYTSSSWRVSEFVSYVSENQGVLPEDLLAGCKGKSKTRYCLLIHLKHQMERDSPYSLITERGFSLKLTLFIASKLGQSEPVFAFSSDTYVVIMHEDDSSKVQNRITTLLLEIEEQCAALAQFVKNQAICGYSRCSGEDVSIPTILMQASMATKIVEDSKKGTSLLFDTDVQTRFLRKQAILAAIPDAFKSSSLSLYYQAQVDVGSGKILGAEALIRWIHPELGFIAPDEFIPLMEENHLTSMLGKFVIREAVGFLKANQEFLRSKVPNFNLAINLSAEEFSNQFIIDFIGDELTQQGVDSSLLSIELTERTAVESLLATGKLMDRLYQIGVGISIDDFGTGYSSLSYLLELSMDKIKIDRSFIASYPDSNAITIYKIVLMLAKELGITVVAEGVETEEQLHFLKQVGCNQYQGYLFSKAVPGDAFLEQLKG
ncbi:MAG: EAL domain-containing protein [Sphaerochaeta sp.]|nr:EAL domain-containing protein [Sphaerochaeta sp.]